MMKVVWSILILAFFATRPAFGQCKAEWLDGYLFEIYDECDIMSTDFASGERTFFYMKESNIKWESVSQYTCIYELPMVEINKVVGFYIPKEHSAGIARSMKGLYISYDSTKYCSTDSGRWGSNVLTLNSGVKQVNPEKFGCHAFVLVYKASFAVEYLEQHKYMSCKGEFREIPEYGWIVNSRNSVKYLYSIILPTFTELPIPDFKRW